MKLQNVLLRIGIVISRIRSVVVQISGSRSSSAGSCCPIVVVVLLGLAEIRVGFIGKCHHPGLLHDGRNTLLILTPIFLQQNDISLSYSSLWNSGNLMKKAFSDVVLVLKTRISIYNIKSIIS